jgi:ankyrin repeat protein
MPIEESRYNHWKRVMQKFYPEKYKELRMQVAKKLLGEDTLKELEEKKKRPKLSPEEQKGLNRQLINAVKEGNLKKVIDLLENGADVNAKNNDGYTALMTASREGHKEIVELLIKNGADVNVKNNDGGTALMYASSKGHKEIVELLIKNGADVNAKNNNG